MSAPVEEPGNRGADLSRPLALLLVAAAVALGVWWRLDGITAMPLYGDEYHGARAANRPYAEIFSRFDLYGTHVPLPLLQHLLATTLEPGIMSFRLPALIAGIATLVLCYPIASSLVGRAPAVVATWALAVSPVHLYYTRFGRAYALTVLLGLVLLGLLARAQRTRWRGPVLLAAILLVAALLPWTHLSSLGLVVGLGLASLGLAWADGGARAALRPLLAFAGGAVLCALLFSPTFEQVIEYADKIPGGRKDRPDGPLGIATVLAGGGIAGLVWMVGLPLATALMWRRNRTAAVLTASSALGSLVFLVVLRPHGMEYAWARYLVNALPALLMLMAWLAVRASPARLGPLVGCTLGLLLVGVVHLTGPLSPRLQDSGAFANTYLAMRTLPAFDRKFRFASPLYEELAADPEVTRIVEAPNLHSRAVLLYRNYYRQHGKEVLIGLVRAPDDVRLNGPYAFVGSPALGRETGAQVLIVHKDLLREVAAYWTFVYERALPRVQSSWNAGFMDRHRTYFVVEEDPKGMAEAMIPPLRTQLGEPFYEDGMLIAWKLRTTRGREGN